MNRENKRKKFEKGYYKNHPCQESFTCKSCGRLVTPGGAVEICHILGKDEVLRRLRLGLEKLGA